eukprot:1473146-Rhodomonas_salina.3
MEKERALKALKHSIALLQGMLETEKVPECPKSPQESAAHRLQEACASNNTFNMKPEHVHFKSPNAKPMLARTTVPKMQRRRSSLEGDARVEPRTTSMPRIDEIAGQQLLVNIQLAQSKKLAYSVVPSRMSRSATVE